VSRTVALVLSIALLASISRAQLPRAITFDDIAHPRPGEWPSYNGLLSANRHSPLDRINTQTVAKLEVKWTHEMGGARPLQMTPIVIDGVMYVAAVNEARALDARTGRQIWQFVRPRTPGLVPTGDPAAGINRGVAVLGQRLFLQTDHAHLVALDRRTGQLQWDVEMADYRLNYGSTGAPLVVNDLVIAGMSAGDEGVRGFLDAYRASTGERVWRFWTVPARGEPGSDTWIGKALEHGCAATWLTGSYDPAAKLLYWPTGNPCPDYNGDERQGDNLYSSSIVALDPATGKLRWHFQFTPHDLHDWDANQPPLLVDANFRGQPRKLLVVANRNGFFYVLDRLSGRMLMAEPFVKNLTWASRIGADGRPQLLTGYENSVEGTRTCPAVSGAANWPSTAFNPATGLFYVMASENCYTYRSTMFSPAARAAAARGAGPARGAAPPEPAAGRAGFAPANGFNAAGPGAGGQQFLRALDIDTGKIVWEIPQTGSSNNYAGTLTTAGGVLFYGASSGEFSALDSKTGKHLWAFETQEGWKASPMTYTVNGRQYVAIAAGANILSFALPR